MNQKVLLFSMFYFVYLAADAQEKVDGKVKLPDSVEVSKPLELTTPLVPVLGNGLSPQPLGLSVASALTNTSLRSPEIPDFSRGIHRNDNLFGSDAPFFLSATNDFMPGLGEKRGAYANYALMRKNLRLNMYGGLEKYSFNDFRRPEARNALTVGGSFQYLINEHWSVSAFGTYTPNAFYHSMAFFPYTSTSEFGGSVNYQNGNWGLSLGSRYTYDPFSRRWDYNPIVMPSFKLGKTKIQVDFGPVLKQSVRQIFVHPRRR